MNVKEAVNIAKTFVSETFADEDLSNIGLEEVEFKEESKVWLVTVGFSRPWQTRSGLVIAGGMPAGRSYKVVTIKDSDRTVVSVKNRAVNDAA